jgi:hypothetical protein
MRPLACLMAGVSGVSVRDFDVNVPSPNVTCEVLSVRDIVIPATLAEPHSRNSVESFIPSQRSFNGSFIFACEYRRLCYRYSMPCP